MPRYTPRNMDELRTCLGNCPADMPVEIEAPEDNNGLFGIRLERTSTPSRAIADEKLIESRA